MGGINIFEFIRFSIIGLLIGLSSSYTFHALFTSNALISGKELRTEYVIAGLLGIFIGWITLIFKTERFGFTTQLTIHFVLVTLSVVVAGYFGNWYDISNINTMLTLLISIIVIYIISWAISLVVLKKDINEINQTIQKRRKS